MLSYPLHSNSVWTGGAPVEGDFAPAGYRFMDGPAPPLEPGQVALALGSSWTVIAEADAPPIIPVPSQPLAISKIDFSRLFTSEQMVRYLALQAQTKAMSAEDFADPTKTVLIQAAVMFAKFDLLPDLIELDHPETVAGVGQVLVAAGVVSAEEAERILANVPPTA